MKHPPRFISFEGGEGCGKSTQVRLLAEVLERAGIDHIVTREPGGDPGAEDIRALLVTGDKDRWEPESELLLFLAARLQHVKRTIKKALSEGAWVISDRFHDSTRVYQGAGKGIGRDYYDMLHYASLGNTAPDLTFLLDMDPRKGVERALSRAGHETRFEAHSPDFHQAVREGFLELARNEPQRIVIIDASADVAGVHQSICASINARLGILL